jgi:hypothetical protein
VDFDPQQDLEALKARAAASPLPADTVVHFPDPNFEAAVRELIGKPVEEGDLLAGDLAGITRLDVSGRGIADLTGIEYFAALEWLDCSDNRLTTLDLSHNPALKKLYCSGNLIRYPSDIQGLSLKRLAYFVFHPQKTPKRKGEMTDETPFVRPGTRRDPPCHPLGRPERLDRADRPAPRRHRDPLPRPGL